MSTVYLDGVACVGKTSLLRQLQQEGYNTGFLDFCEFRAEIGPGHDELYPVWYSQRSHQFAVIDRSPVANILYKVVYDETLLIENVVNTLHVDGKLIVFLTRPGEESLVVEAMRRRANGIDTLSIAYVKRQNEIFRAFAEHTGATIVEIGFNEDGPMCETALSICRDIIDQ